MKKLKVILTGATGMIGEAVLHECLLHPMIDQVLIVSRKSSGFQHAKLSEIVVDDLSDISSIQDQLKDYDACYFCVGTTSVGKSEEEFFRLTYTLTIGFASTLVKANPDMTFCYISGAGTGVEKRQAWAKIKGRTENDLIKLGFKSVYHFRPGGLQPFLPLKPSQTYYKSYKYFGWLISITKILFPNTVMPLKDFANAMINVSLSGYHTPYLEVKDIKALAGKPTTIHSQIGRILAFSVLILLIYLIWFFCFRFQLPAC